MRRCYERDKNVRNNNLKTPVKTDIGQPKFVYVINILLMTA